MARLSTWRVATTIGLFAVGCYFLLPGVGAKDIGYSVIGLSSVVAVLVGSRNSERFERRGWYALASGTLCFVAGDGVYDVYQFVLHRVLPFPSVSDAFYLAGYPFLMVGVVCLTRHADQPSDRESYADAAIIIVAALALSWHLLLGTYAHNPNLSVFSKLVTFAYPVMDLGVAFIVLRDLAFRCYRAPAIKLLAAAMVLMVIADFSYDLLSVHGSYQTGNPIDAGWLLNYVLVGSAALYPRRVTKELAGRRGAGKTREARLPAVALAGFVPPTILVVDAISGARGDFEPLSTISLALFALVILRMRWMVTRMASQTRSLEDVLATKASLETELRHQAFHDSLTGLANRALLHDRVGHALASARRRRKLVALCFCDLDGFKAVNDSLGHLVGDALLVTVGERLVAATRSGDTVARIGGDEFAVLAEDGSSERAALDIAERIVSILRDPMIIQGHRISLSVSVGVAVADQYSTTERLLSQADSAMYEAKEAGKDRFEVFDASMHARLAERLDLSSALDSALEYGQFFLEYQPQYSLDSGELEGFEALIRWAHPTLGLVNPDRFISVAEETGHIVSVGRWVTEKACEEAATWMRETQRPVRISVNLSGRQLVDKNIVDDVRTALALAGLPPDRLTLEITESVLIADSAGNFRVLSDLRALGVRLAIDDFGTGYSSLSYLRRMPVDELKIDKSFIEPLGREGDEALAFVKTIVSLAGSLNLHTVAEGVETDSQRALLHEVGCASAQGYLFDRPLDRQAATELVRRVDRLVSNGEHPITGRLHPQRS